MTKSETPVTTCIIQSIYRRDRVFEYKSKSHTCGSDKSSGGAMAPGNSSPLFNPSQFILKHLALVKTKQSNESESGDQHYRSRAYLFMNERTNPRRRSNARPHCTHSIRSVHAHQQYSSPVAPMQDEGNTLQQLGERRGGEETPTTFGGFRTNTTTIIVDGR